MLVELSEYRGHKLKRVGRSRGRFLREDEAVPHDSREGALGIVLDLATDPEMDDEVKLKKIQRYCEGELGRHAETGDPHSAHNGEVEEQHRRKNKRRPLPSESIMERITREERSRAAAQDE